jgi:beta-lactamase superfamily II metal-dependent hydrolase
LWLAILPILSSQAMLQAAPKGLDIYFIDVEGGAATLIVTPAGQSLLIDTGFPGERDAGRIARVALEVAWPQTDRSLCHHSLASRSRGWCSDSRETDTDQELLRSRFAANNRC